MIFHLYIVFFKVSVREKNSIVLVTVVQEEKNYLAPVLSNLLTNRATKISVK